MALPFVCREEELVRGRAFLQAVPSGDSALLLIQGDSGTGKSELLRRILERLTLELPSSLCLHLDLTNDQYFLARFFDCLSCLAWTARREPANGLNVPKDFSLSVYLRRRKVKERFFRSAEDVVKTASELLPLPSLAKQPLSTAADIVGMNVGDLGMLDLTSQFNAYLAHAASKRPVFLAVDNYQYLDTRTRLYFESRLADVRQNLGLVLVNRTKENQSTIELPTTLYEEIQTLQLSVFSADQTAVLVREFLPEDEPNLEKLASDCHLKTGGNLKEIEYYLNQYSAGGGEEAKVQHLVATLGSMPEEARMILAIASLFPGGVSADQCQKIMKKLFLLADEAVVLRIIRKLAQIDYIVVGSDTRRMIQPGHEKVLLVLQQVLEDTEVLSLRSAALEVVNSELTIVSSPREYSYLLHCFVGLLSLADARRQIDRVAELIDLHYKQSNFGYIVELYRSMGEVLHSLPPVVLEEVLEAFQRTSEFFLGLTAIASLRERGALDPGRLNAYSARFLMQRYHYEAALDILEELPVSEERDLYRALCLQYLRRETKAREILEAQLAGRPLSRLRAIMLRNSAHLFSAEKAMTNLARAYDYFKEREAEFEVATVRNNEGVVCLWAGDDSPGEKYLEEARSRLEQLGSNEVYQPLINLGVLATTGGSPAKGLERFSEARRWLPRALTLDRCILDSNIVLTQLAANPADTRSSFNRLKEIYKDARKIPNPRLRDQISYNLQAVGCVAGIDTTVEASKEFHEALDARHKTSLERELVLVMGETKFRCLLILSPHWRY